MPCPPAPKLPQEDERCLLLVGSLEDDLEGFLNRELHADGFDLSFTDPGVELTEAARRREPAIIVIDSTKERYMSAPAEITTLSQVAPGAKIIILHDSGAAKSTKIIEKDSVYYAYVPQVTSQEVVDVIRGACERLWQDGHCRGSCLRDRRRG